MCPGARAHLPSAGVEARRVPGSRLTAGGKHHPTRESLRVPASPRPEATPRALSPQVLGIHVNKWRLDRKLGMCVLALYAVFLCFSIMIEFNVFTFVNLPMCREDD